MKKKKLELTYRCINALHKYCDCFNLNLYFIFFHPIQIISNALALSEFYGSKYDYDMTQNDYVPEPPPKHNIKTLLGPVYEVLNEHHYNQIQAIAQELQTLQGPIYTQESKHHFSEI